MNRAVYYYLTLTCRTDDQVQYEYDSTGIFHWCPARALEDVVLSRYGALLAGWYLSGT